MDRCYICTHMEAEIETPGRNQLAVSMKTLSQYKTVHEAFKKGAATVFRPHGKVNSKHDSYIYPLR